MERSQEKLKEKIKEMLKDKDKVKEQIDRAKEKMEKGGIKDINLTDMDSRIMKMKKGNDYQQGYNCQLIVEDKSEIIVGNNLSDSPTDHRQTVPVFEKFKEEQKASLKDVEIFQDNGYCSSEVAEYHEKEGSLAYIPDRDMVKKLHGKKIGRFDTINFQLDFEKNQAICPAGHRMDFLRKKVNKKTNGWTNLYCTDKCLDCSFRGECVYEKKKHRLVEINPLIRKISLRLATKQGIDKYNKRFHKGEVAQAHIEHNLGYREFKSRGIESCENEMNLFSTAYNLRKIYNRWRENGRRLFVNAIKILFLRKLTELCYES